MKNASGESADDSITIFRSQGAGADKKREVETYTIRLVFNL